jgi:hypothetical protein
VLLAASVRRSRVRTLRALAAKFITPAVKRMFKDGPHTTRTSTSLFVSRRAVAPVGHAID